MDKESEENARNKIITFSSKAWKYTGKEIVLPSDEFFSINREISQEDGMKNDMIFNIQWGFPNSGGVFIKFNYSKRSLTDISVYAPPKGKNILLTSIAPKETIASLPEVGVTLQFGIDSGCEEHQTLDEIAANPNALEMLDIAIKDLENAEVIGICSEVSSDSTIIPVSCSRLSRDVSKGR